MKPESILGNKAIFLIFFVAALAIYLTALDNDFYLDDGHQITENTFIRTLGSIPRFFYNADLYSRGTVVVGHYRPLLLSTFVLNYYLGGLNPLGYHLINLLFHILSAYTLFLIVERLLSSRMAGVVAGLFVLTHPFNSEVVNYVTARSSVMATFFYLLTFYAYLRYRLPHLEDKDRGERGEGRPWLYLSWVAFTLGLLTKEILITLPLILVLYEIFFISIPLNLPLNPPIPPLLKGGKGGLWGLLRRMPPFLLISLSYLIVRRVVTGGAPPGFARNLWINLLLQFKVLAMIWQMLVLPVNQSFIHEIPDPESLWEWGVIGAFLLLVGLLAIMVWALRSTRQDIKVIGFSLIWFYVTLLPTTLIPLNIVLQENRGYIAGISFAILGGVFFMHLVSWGKGRLKRVAWGGLGVILVAYGIGVINRNAVWDNEINLWQDAIHKVPQSHQAHYGLGIAYAHLGWFEAAAEELRVAINLNRERPDIHSDLGGIYMYLKQEELAEKEYQEAIRLYPLYDRAHTNLGILYRRRGNLELAREEFETALKIYPYSETALKNMGMLYLQQDRPDSAMALWTAVLEKNPNLPTIQWLVGRIYRDRGDAVAARQAFDRAVWLDPSLRGKENVEGSK